MDGTHPSRSALETSAGHTAAPNPALQGNQTLRNPSTTRLPLPGRVRRSLLLSLARSRIPRSFPPCHAPRIRTLAQPVEARGRCGPSQPVPAGRRGEGVVMNKIPRTSSAWCTGRGSLRIGLGRKAACQWGPRSRNPGGAAEEQRRLHCSGDAHPVLSRPGQYLRLLRTVVYVCLQRRPPEVSSPVFAK